MELTPFQVNNLRRLVERWADAAYRGDSNDAEHDRAHDLADHVAGLIGFEVDTSDEVTR